MADLPKWPLYCLFPSLPFNLAFITPHRSQPAREEPVKLLQLYLNFNHPLVLAFYKTKYVRSKLLVAWHFFIDSTKRYLFDSNVTFILK